jgi:1,2-phenylacetyl-CoA epoxidase catalytic subunit
MFNGQSKPDKDKDGCYFIDRSGKYFDHILNYLRDSSYRPPSDIMAAVINEAQYFHLGEYAQCMQLIQQTESPYMQSL